MTPVDTPVPFTKMSGSGNDFIVIDHRSPMLPDDEIASFTRAACRRGTGLGADGVILIETTARTDVHFRWRYINADGSNGEMCGNGAMCGARFAVRLGIAPDACRFETDAGDVDAEVRDGGRDPRVSLRLPDVTLPPDPVEVAIEGETWAFDRLLVGVPHAVTVVSDADARFAAGSFARWGRSVRRHSAFAPAGTNVNLVHRIGDATIRMRTYERGVEAETLACGTGAVASAIVAVARGLVALPVRVIVSSGETLMVEFRSEDAAVTDIRLEGSSRVIATGQLDPEGLAPD